ncbi:MAG: ester cyclase, partial [Actinomycetota bacterium]
KTAFPDRSTDVHHVIAEGDKVAAVQTIRATNTGEFMGMAPTGKSFEVFSIHIVRVAGGKIAEHWGLLDQGGLMMQLGVMPMPPGTESWRPPPTSPQATSGGSGDPDRNRRALDEMIAAMRIGKMDDVLALVHEEDVDHAALPGQAPGKEGTRWRFEQLFSGLTEPDFRTLASVGEGPFLSQAYTFTATHTGPMMGMPPTNKSFTVSAIDFVLFEDGKFLEHWGLIDVPAMMAQLG